MNEPLDPLVEGFSINEKGETIESKYISPEPDRNYPILIEEFDNED